MRSIAVLAILGLAVAQAAGVLSCACGNECSLETPSAPKVGCCGEEVQDPVPEPECCCSHVTEVMEFNPVILPRAPALLAFVEATPVPSGPITLSTPSIFEHPPPRRGRPIYLAISTFRL